MVPGALTPPGSARSSCGGRSPPIRQPGRHDPGGAPPNLWQARRGAPLLRLRPRRHLQRHRVPPQGLVTGSLRASNSRMDWSTSPRGCQRVPAAFWRISSRRPCKKALKGFLQALGGMRDWIRPHGVRLDLWVRPTTSGTLARSTDGLIDAIMASTTSYDTRNLRANTQEHIKKAITQTIWRAKTQEHIKKKTTHARTQFYSRYLQAQISSSSSSRWIPPCTLALLSV
ncbi:uncharacterized protein LOC112350697 [Selaginella moellendorffii]|uniref:uncharacterized protein LOC112350697 n=1 Tax=Selaginella moellendorffii TaxID=88036 RepID=UPI000D1C3827|nr:uncharacterized protein LOC112350697 [Selaginella moellendorffii]|eukprot:XP_024543120.1 uncharacterized protein LOC112350697 [Selaginella moellendorffii]